MIQDDNSGRQGDINFKNNILIFVVLAVVWLFDIGDGARKQPQQTYFEICTVRHTVSVGIITNIRMG
jgi:hypothetical protein